MRVIAAALLIATGLAGCQTMEPSRRTAQEICSETGLRPGTRTFKSCVSSRSRQQRLEAQTVAGALIAGDERLVRYERHDDEGGPNDYGQRPFPYSTGFYGNSQLYLRRGCNGWGC